MSGRKYAGGVKNLFFEDLEVAAHTESVSIVLVKQCAITNYTLAMSSVFLNSPLTRVTLPSSLNSVQRNLSSLTLDALLRPRLAPFASSNKLASGAGSLGLGEKSLLRRPKILSKSGRELVDT